MRTLHLTADLFCCRGEPAWLNAPGPLKDLCAQAAGACGFRVADGLFAHEADQGVVGTLLMVGARLQARTWPAERAALLDVQIDLDSGGDAQQARALLELVVARLAPEWTEQRSLDRGDEA